MFFSKKLKSFKEINHCFFSRKSGYSKGLYKSLNCGRGSRDNKKNINRNLRYVSKKMNRKNNELVLMHQSHSNRVLHRQKAHRGTARRSRVSPQRKYSWDVAELPAFLDALRASISFSRTPSPGSKPTSDGLNLGGSHALAPSTDRPWAIRNSRLK